ncbi:MAG: hypothetical protein SGJ27_04100 [Candidatus Melainabacteria bacterium]|nr:hypothetical protein [Candidatus Melainabacteria bacterium]
MRRVDRNQGNRRLQLASIALAATLTLAPLTANAEYVQPDRSEARIAFREFKANNPDRSKRELRNLYRSPFTSSNSNTSAPQATTADLIFNANSSASRLNQRVEQNVREYRNNTVQLQDSGRLRNSKNGIDLDLNSASQSITLGAKLFQNAQQVTIERGGQQITLAAGSTVTASEYIAVKQLLLTGAQSIQLDGTGKSIGGSVDLSQITARNDRMRADDLNIPVNVTAYGDFSKGSTFQVSGDLVNAGSIYALDSKRGTAGGALRADNLINSSTGLISSESQNGLDARIDLTLAATGNLLNQGSITSSGDLILTAGNSITNHGTATQAAAISARGNLEASAKDIINHGLIRSSDGNVRFNSAEDYLNGALTIDNRLGEVQALNGAINLRDRSFRQDASTYVYGGDFLSKQFNVFTGRGTADLNVNKLTGTLNQDGFASHVTAETTALTLGDICLSGDPTYKNAGGDIIIGGNITVQEALTIIAEGSILNSGPAVITAANNTTGFNVTFIAGADITSVVGTDNTIVGPIPPALAGAATDISGLASASGGTITLGADPLAPVTINTRSTGGGDTNGGDVLFAAFDSFALTGTIELTNTKINTGGKGNGNNGNVTLIAGGLGDVPTITVGAVDTTGGNGTGGDINISGFTPQSTGGTISYDANGNRTSVAALVAGPSSMAGSNILTSGDLTAAGNVTVRTGLNGNISIGEFNITTKGANSVVDLKATGTGNITGTDFTTITTRTLNLTTDTGDIGDPIENTPIFANAGFMNATGSAASTDILLVSFNPGLNVISATGSSINIATQGTIISDPSKGPIVADELLIGSFGGGTGINEFRPLEVTANDLFVAGLGGNVFVHNNNAGLTNLTGGDALQAKGIFSVTTDGTISLGVDETISAQNILLTPALGFTSVLGLLKATSSVSLTTPVSIDATTVAPLIQSPVLKVTSLNGDVGTSVNRLLAGTTVTSIAAFAPNGNVFLQGSVTSKAILAGGAAGKSFDYKGTGTTTITGNVSSGTEDLNIVISGPGTLTIGSGVSLVSGRNMTVALSDPLNSTKLKIAFGVDSSLQTKAAPGFGNILVSVGPAGAPVVGTPPAKGIAFVEVPPNKIFWGTFAPTGKGVNTVFANGADVQFTNSLKSGAITVGGGVTIVSD